MAAPPENSQSDIEAEAHDYAHAVYVATDMNSNLKKGKRIWYVFKRKINETFVQFLSMTFQESFFWNVQCVPNWIQ